MNEHTAQGQQLGTVGAQAAQSRVARRLLRLVVVVLASVGLTLSMAAPAQARMANQTSLNSYCTMNAAATQYQKTWNSTYHFYSYTQRGRITISCSRGTYVRGYATLMRDVSNSADTVLQNGNTTTYYVAAGGTISLVSPWHDVRCNSREYYSRGSAYADGGSWKTVESYYNYSAPC